MPQNDGSDEPDHHHSGGEAADTPDDGKDDEDLELSDSAKQDVKPEASDSDALGNEAAQRRFVKQVSGCVV